MGNPQWLRVFVYGTLKRGGRYHQHCCQGVRAIEPATVRGRLYRLSQGYPILVIPAESVLAVGSADPWTDCRRQQEHGLSPESPRCLPAAEWVAVTGEVLSFDDPADRLPRLDALEGFKPMAEPGLYDRVLIFVDQPAQAPAWTYVAPGGRPPSGAVWLPQASWIETQAT